VEEIEPHIAKKTKMSNYKLKEDETLCYAWMSIGTSRFRPTNEGSFCKRISEYYASHVLVPSNRTQGSIIQCWSVIQDCCNQWSDCVDQVKKRRVNLHPRAIEAKEEKLEQALHCDALLHGAQKKREVADKSLVVVVVAVD
jgi:hypothetical protein